MLRAKQQIGQINLPRHIGQARIGAFAKDGLGTWIDREKLSGKAMLAEINLRARGQALRVR